MISKTNPPLSDRLARPENPEAAGTYLCNPPPLPREGYGRRSVDGGTTRASSTWQIRAFLKGNSSSSRDDTQRRGAKAQNSKHLIADVVHERVGVCRIRSSFNFCRPHTACQPFQPAVRTLFTRRGPPLISDSPQRSFRRHFAAVHGARTPRQKGRLYICMRIAGAAE